LKELEEKDKKLVLQVPGYILQPASQEQGRTDVESPEIILVIKMQNKEMFTARNKFLDLSIFLSV